MMNLRFTVRHSRLLLVAAAGVAVAAAFLPAQGAAARNRHNLEPAQARLARAAALRRHSTQPFDRAAAEARFSQLLSREKAAAPSA